MTGEEWIYVAFSPDGHAGRAWYVALEGDLSTPESIAVAGALRHRVHTSLWYRQQKTAS